MLEYKVGYLVRSLAGHDKNHLFIIIKESGEYVYLVDGKNRTLEKPKCKKKKHVQAVYHKDETLSRKLVSHEPVTDEEIKYVIKCYNRENQDI